MKIVVQPSEYSFARNPILFEVETDTQDLLNVSVSTDDEIVNFTYMPFGNEAPYKVKFDVSSVLLPFFKESAIDDSQDAICLLEDFILNYQVKIGEQILELKAINGGVSEEQISYLASFGLDAFQYRILNLEKQFLLTTRTNLSSISLKETELFPFTFLHPGKAISITSGNGNTMIFPSEEQGTSCLLDVDSLRRLFYELYEEIPSYLEVGIDGVKVFDITIIPNKITETLSFLRFRNSLGGFEQIEITGKPYFSPEITDAEKFKHFTGRVFEDRRAKREFKSVIEVESGYKSQNELLHVLDMLCSDLTYYIQSDGFTRRCYVEADEYKVALNMTTPNSIPLKITMVNDGTNYSPSLDITKPGAWILDTSYWDDYASWRDNRLWID